MNRLNRHNHYPKCDNIYLSFGKHVINKCILVVLLFCLSFKSIAFEQAAQEGTPLKINGVTAEQQSNIEIHLGVEEGIVPYSILGFPRSNEYILKTSKLALRALGYYQPEIELTGDHRLWQLDIKVGEPILLSSVDIQIVGGGNNLTIFKKPLTSHTLKVASKLDHGSYENLKSQLISVASENGFLDATFVKKELAVDIQASTAAITLLFDTKKIYNIGLFEIKGSELSQEFLIRYLHLKTGNTYSQQDVIKTQQALNRSGYFSTINIEQQIDTERKQVDLTIQLTDIEKYEFKTTLGFGTDSGASIGLGWHNRKVNDKGHQYLISADMSEIEQSTSFQYKLPIEGRKNELIYRYSFRLRDDELARSKLSSVETRMLLFHNDYWSTQTALTLADEMVNSQASINTHLNYLIPSWRIQYYSVADPFSAETGWRWQNDIRLSSDSLSDPDIEFIQLEQKIKSIWALSDTWRVLLRLHAGYTHMNTEKFNQSMPTNYRFFAGGDVSVRGYKYQTLSPQDVDKNYLGGKHLLTSSLEMDWRFNDDFRWAIFADQGSAFNEFSDKNLRTSVGTGFRWVTPVGSIRFDVARSLDEPKEWRWHITVGPDL